MRDMRAGGGTDSRGDFAFYVLALSWSPSYCAAEGADTAERQCGDGRSFGFIVHGLWPQYERGWPEYCADGDAGRVPRMLVAGMLDIMPSAGLVGHQWRKHGTCTGLSQEDYFARTRAARERLSVPRRFTRPSARRDIDPQSVERAFVEANPGLTRDGIAATCDRRRLREVRVCLTRELAFRDCPRVVESACERSRVRMPAADGR